MTSSIVSIVKLTYNILSDEFCEEEAMWCNEKSSEFEDRRVNIVLLKYLLPPPPPRHTHTLHKLCHFPYNNPARQVLIFPFCPVLFSLYLLDSSSSVHYANYYVILGTMFILIFTFLICKTGVILILTSLVAPQLLFGDSQPLFRARLALNIKVKAQMVTFRLQLTLLP